MTMLRVILHGACGRMGKAIESIVSQTDDIKIVCGVDKLSQGNEDFPFFTKISDCDIEADVVVDFSHYTAVPELIDYCVRKSLPVVIATTSLDSKCEEALVKAAESVAVFRSANMSLGINGIAGILKSLVALLEEDFDVEIIEKHHSKKVDSPSGTAILLADAVNEGCKIPKEYIYGRHGKDDIRKRETLGIHAIRGGTIPGEHTVIFAGEDEVIEITHSALSRNIFAKGAVKAARFIAKKDKGLFSMKDIVDQAV